MVGLESVRRTVEHRTSKYAVLAGLVAALYAVGRYWYSADLSLFGPVFVAGLAVGLVRDRGDTESRRVGFHAGVIASSAVLWPALELLAFAAGLAQPRWIIGVQAAMVLVYIVVTVFVSGFLGMVGAAVGDWLAEKTDRHRPFVFGT